MDKKGKALKYISHGAYLQIFFGFCYLLPGLVLPEEPEIMFSPGAVGGLLLVLALNTLIYIRRYKKALAAEGSGR